MSKRLSFLKEVGEEGLPKGVDPKYQDVWDTYLANKSETDRILSVLGFFHLLTQAGLRRGKGVAESAKKYNEILTEDFTELAKRVLSKVAKYRLFDVLRTYKSDFSLDKDLRSPTKTFRITLCLEPKRNEHLDGALAKLRGLLYTDELPTQLREVWRKLPINSKAKPKSALPPYTSFLNTSTLGYLPLHVDNGFRLYTARAKDGILILRIEIPVQSPSVPWYAPRKHDEVLKSLLTKAFMKIKG